MKAPFPRNRSIKEQAEKNSLADLRSRFLELKELRQKVRLAECGRIAATQNGARHRSSRATTAPRHEPEPGLH